MEGGRAGDRDRQLLAPRNAERVTGQRAEIPPRAGNPFFVTIQRMLRTAYSPANAGVDSVDGELALEYVGIVP